jgi:hypothetical protein
MELEGKLWKNKKLWMAHIPALGLVTQSATRQTTLENIQASVKELVHFYFPSEAGQELKITLCSYPKGIIGVAMADLKLLLALSLRRQREQSGLTIREVAHRLGSKSPNAYAQYERGKIRISLDKFEQLLQAANPKRKSFLRIS